VSPSYNVTDADVDAIVDRVGRLVEDFFTTLDVPSTPAYSSDLCLQALFGFATQRNTSKDL
jgi:hypothetical protein